MTSALMQNDGALWEGIRKNYSNKLSKLEEQETYLKCKVDALEKLLDRGPEPCLCNNKKKSSPDSEFQFPIPNDPCGINKGNNGLKKKDDCGCGRPKTENTSGCSCDPCAYKTKYNASCKCEGPAKLSECSCNKQPPKCTCNEKPPTCTCNEKEKEPPKCTCDERRLQELLDKIEQSAPEILSADVKIPKNNGVNKQKCHCDNQLEEVLKSKIMPIIDEMLAEDFCSCCEDVQHVFDPINSKHKCSCLSMLEIKPNPKSSRSKQKKQGECSSSRSSGIQNLRNAGQMMRRSSQKANGGCVCDNSGKKSSTKGKHSEKCECIECVCDPCSPNNVIALPGVGCECIECVCEPCQACDQPPHPEACDCKECDCEYCPDKEKRHPETCECKDCVCEKCPKLEAIKGKETTDCGCDPCPSSPTSKQKIKEDRGCGCGSPTGVSSKGRKGSKIPVSCICKDPCPCDPCYFDPKALDDLVKGDGSSQDSCICGPKPKSRSASRKKPSIRSQLSNMSLRSVDIAHMNEIISMFNKQKQIKRKIQELEKKAEHYNKKAACKC